MTISTALLPTADELVTAALAGVDRALGRLDQLTPSAWVHAIQQDLTVVRLTLLTRPLRPEEVAG